MYGVYNERDQFGNTLYPKSNVSRVGTISKNYVTDNLIFHLDARNPDSYPGTGSTWYDLSGNNYNGTLVNGPTYNSANEGSIFFDGTNDHVTLPSGFANFTGGLTIEAWVYSTNNNSFGRIIDLSSGVNSGNILLSRDSSNNDMAIYIYTTSFTSLATTSTQYPINQWAHWVATANGTTWVIYKNGSSVATLTTSILPTNVTRTVNYIARSVYNDPYFQGNISIERMYDRALSASEVLQNYNAEKSRYGL